MASKQRDYQKRHLQQGLCIQCPSPSLPKKGRCFRHHMFYMLRKYGMAKGVVSERVSNKREKLCAHLSGRFHAIKGGYLLAGDRDQRLKDALEIRLRLNIKWGGVAGSRKLAAVMRSLDRLAAKMHEEQRNESSKPDSVAQGDRAR